MKKILFYSLCVLLLPIATKAYTIQYGDTPFTLWGNNWRQEMQRQIGHTNQYNLPVGVDVSLDEMLGAAPIPTDNYDSFLTSPLSSSATTVFVNDLPVGVSSTIYTIFANDGTTPREKIYCTGTETSPNRATGCTRGVSFSPVSGVIDESGGTGLPHSKNARIAITDNINFSGKALAILNGSQPTSANFFRIGTATTTGNDPCLAFDDGSSSTSTRICKNVGTDELYWSDDGINTYSFTSSSVSQLTASSTRGIGVTNGEIHVNASSTTGLTFDSSGSLYQAIGNALEYTNNAIGVSTSTIVAQIATTTPTANSIVISESDGNINTGWIDQTELTSLEYNSLLGVTTTNKNSGGTATVIATTTISGGTLGTSNGVEYRVDVDDFDMSNGESASWTLKYGNTNIVTFNCTNDSGSGITNKKGFIDVVLLAAGSTSSQEARIRVELLTDDDDGFVQGDRIGCDVYRIGTVSEDSTTTKSLALFMQFSSSGSVTIGRSYAVALR